MSSPDDSYQPLVTGPLGTNEMNAINDLGRPTASGPLGRPFSLDPMGPRAMLSLGDGNQPPSVGPVGRPWRPEQPGDQVTEPDYKWTTQTRSESESNTGAPDSVIQTESEVHTGRVNISMANGPTDSSVIPPSSDSVVRSLGERTTQTKSESESVAGIPDPVIQTGSEVQTDRVNISTDNGLTNSRETSPSSDSGVHSWTEQWENMSENLTDSSAYHAVDSHQEDSGRVSHLEFRAPPNTEDEDDSDYSDTDGLLAKKLGGCPSEGMYGKNGRITYSAVTGSGSERNADIAALSDFSDDSSELGVRQRLECRTPVPVQPILPTGDYAPILRTPPVKARSWAELLLLEQGSTSSTWSRWDYGTLPEVTDPGFINCIKSMTLQRLARDADPRLDRYYPKLVQSLAKAGRISRDMWYDHDRRLNKEGTVCIAPGCQCRMRVDMMLRTFDEEMERVDSVSARFPDRHVRKYVIRFNDGSSHDEVPGTSTPPIRRRRCRKYASLRKYETDVEDYFSCSDEEEQWIDRSNAWYQHC